MGLRPALSVALLAFAVVSTVGASPETVYIEFYERTETIQKRLELLQELTERELGTEFWDYIFSDLYMYRSSTHDVRELALVEQSLVLVLNQFSVDSPTAYPDRVFSIARQNCGMDLKVAAIVATGKLEIPEAHEWVAESLMQLTMAPGADMCCDHRLAEAFIVSLYYTDHELAEPALMMAGSEFNWFPDRIRDRAVAISRARAQRQ